MSQITGSTINVLAGDAIDPTRTVTARALGTELLDRADFKKLRQILLGSPAVASLRALYRQAIGNVEFPLPTNPDNVLDYIGSLRMLVNPRPLFEFLMRFQAAAQDPSTAEQLALWLSQTAPKCDVDLHELEEELRDELHRTVVVVRLEPDILADGWQVTAWTYAAGEGRLSSTTEEPWDREQLGKLLSEQFEAYVDEFDPTVGSVQLTVEFLVGLDMLNADLEALTLSIHGHQLQIGTACPVVIRSIDRLAEQGSTDAWHDNWRELQQRGSSYDANAIDWVKEGTGAETGRLCAALADLGDSNLSEFLRLAIAAGTPVAIWHRAAAKHPNPRTALQQVLGVSGLLDLPETVMRQRINARHPKAPQGHSGHDLVLLWDDPDRVPPDLQWQEPTLEGVSP